ncbi:YqaA family protein [Thalassospira mesophila]|uniref:YqaA family protein n=1 Tax=Thalassospira mesophila TaxID=1293891 RepID=UPI001FE930E2|nr:VTT domain-containing protein [Thalassospira mesophila]
MLGVNKAHRLYGNRTPMTELHSGDDKKSFQKTGFAGFWQRLRRPLEALAAGKRGLTGIGVASFLETTIIPIPVEIIITPLMAISRKRGMQIATVTLAGSLLGAVVLYLLAWGMFDNVVTPFLDWSGGHEQFYQLQNRFRDGGFWVVFIISITPAPMQLAALAAGVTNYSFWLFFSAIFLSRAIRYYGLFAIVRLFGAGYVRYFSRRGAKQGSKEAK